MHVIYVYSLKSRLNERQGTCSANTARFLKDCLHTVQQWNQREPSELISSVQVDFYFFKYTVLCKSLHHLMYCLGSSIMTMFMFIWFIRIQLENMSL